MKPPVREPPGSKSWLDHGAVLWNAMAVVRQTRRLAALSPLLLRYRYQRLPERMEPLLAAIESDPGAALMALGRANDRARRESGQAIYSLSQARKENVLPDSDLVEVTLDSFDAWRDIGFRVSDDVQLLWNTVQTVWQRRWTLRQATRHIVQSIPGMRDEMAGILASQSAGFYGLGMGAIFFRGAAGPLRWSSVLEVAGSPEKLEQLVGSPEGMLTRNLLQAMGVPQPLANTVDHERMARGDPNSCECRAHAMVVYALSVCELQWHHQHLEPMPEMTDRILDCRAKLGDECVSPEELYKFIQVRRNYALGLSASLFSRPPPLDIWALKGYPF